MTEDKKNRTATALQYEGKHAPTITAKGHGDLADDIIAVAREHGVLVHQDDQLSQLLSQLQLGDQIPPELYIVIAELIAFSYVLQGKFPENWHNIHQRIDLKS
ncbi:EscU/YscU/HrcU family type III secretion system export apparatus switch protein [Rheinheimera baltica]|uniref:EscU/YscU/HrcU family type III secretion system export apparatus switch protein n=1 Tax=Rheinheimera baltica TaxID=67576 RepID=UPI000421EB8A|nr:EscU/YscU/HrcU family type III secretion system export apparatus switch protein [Rheinheimera baltica]MDP5143142.1 EscU/YscU/HrcU family type III secretion system export apparatus switch protein [Rheinheimera baltica]MDP5149852.1 EscU/YscU/HrcU family type III secretion system export apparatus switch protein [Rheinheimera baltica]MDP5189792.1 EscU/YscU/HrcU family type III secretion system export apparatus switch protein [Rheinheimera baltica]